MNLKSIAVIFALSSMTSVAAGSSNLESYYQWHQAEAIATYDECKAQMATLTTTGNVKAIMELAENQQCKAAERAVNLVATGE